VRGASGNASDSIAKQIFADRYTVTDLPVPGEPSVEDVNAAYVACVDRQIDTILHAVVVLQLTWERLCGFASRRKISCLMISAPFSRASVSILTRYRSSPSPRRLEQVRRLQLSLS
jgi:hypothetical protein